MTTRLKNKVVLLPGGAAGIGRECAMAYGREGATVVMRDRNFGDAVADYGRHGIRVNAICPAIVCTPMLEAWAASEGVPETSRQHFGELSLLGYRPDGDASADAAAFLLTDEARFITGCILPVSGGTEIGYKR